VVRSPFAGYEEDSAGVRTKYLFVGLERLALKRSSGGPSATFWYHSDHLGGVHLLTDASGLKVQLVEYDPWGKVTRTEGTVDLTHRFTGQALDPETGLYYYGGRYYDPHLARFISPDPFVPAPGNPQSLNRYSYTLNDPVNHVDPSGYFFSSLWKKLIGPIFGLIVGALLSSSGCVPCGVVAGGFVAGYLSSVVANPRNPTGALLNGAIGGAMAAAGYVAFGQLSGVLGPLLDGSKELATQLTSAALTGAALGAVSAAISGSNPGLGAAYGAATAAVLAAVVHGGYRLVEWFSSSGIADAQASGDSLIEVGARSLASGDGNSPVGNHKVLRYQVGDDVYYAEMAPEAGRIKVHEGSLRQMTEATQRAVDHKAITWHRTTVNLDVLTRAIEGYKQLFQGEPYRWYSFNSNYFVNSVVSAAGGNPTLPGVFAPAFAPGPGRVLLAPVPGY
jgi:RHS repeat-associated protein